MADIFGRENMAYGGGFVSDKGIIQDGKGLSGLLMQNIQVQYQRPITKIYELGQAGQASKVYYVEGRPQGSMTIGRVIGFNNSMATFYQQYGSACNANKNDLSLNMSPAQCEGTQNLSLTMHACVLSSIGFSVQAQQLVINENSTLEFANMSFGGGGGIAATAANIANGIAGAVGGFVNGLADAIGIR